MMKTILNKILQTIDPICTFSCLSVIEEGGGWDQDVANKYSSAPVITIILILQTQKIKLISSSYIEQIIPL